MKIFITNIEKQIIETDYKQIIETFPKEKRRNVENYKNTSDKMRCIYGELLCRYSLYIKYGIDSFDYYFNEYGKPYLLKHALFFNISHSYNRVVCAVGEREMGIDVEKLRAGKESICKCFTKREQNRLIAITPEKTINYIFKLWTLKESYIKYKGKGLSIPLNSFEILINQEKIELEKSNEELKLMSYEMGGGYLVSVCSHEICQEIEFINNETLLSFADKFTAGICCEKREEKWNAFSN